MDVVVPLLSDDCFCASSRIHCLNHWHNPRYSLRVIEDDAVWLLTDSSSCPTSLVSPVLNALTGDFSSRIHRRRHCALLVAHLHLMI